MQFRFPNARRTALAAAMLSVLTPAFAQDPATELDGVVVTATRTIQRQDETLSATTVIEREQIERLQATSLPELLRGTPGLSLSNTGGAGKETSVFLRGTESDHVLVLVDGIKIGSATAGKAALQDIPVEQIERIEIVRGPFSSLYGSEALGGVIQIFTRRPQGAFAPNFSVAAGSHDTQRIGAGVGGRGEQGWYSIHAAHEDTDGIDAYRDNPASSFDDSSVDPDRDGYRNRSLTLRGGYRFSEQWDAEARAFRAEGKNEYDGSFQNQAENVQQVVGARLRYAPSDAVSLTLNGGRSDDLSDNFLDGAFTGTFDTHRLLGSVQADLSFGDALVTFGYDWLRDEVDSTEPFAVTQRIDRGVFGQWQQTFGAHSLQASLRHDDDSQFGGETTGSATWGWTFTQALRLTASYGTAFKAPSFNELYFPFFGNPNLRPETSRSIELGLRGEHGWGGWSINAFDTEADDLIAYDATLVDADHPFGQPNNIDRARLQGVEVTADTTLAGWDLLGSVTWLDPRNDGDGANYDNILPRRARESARVDADRRYGDFSVGASVYAAGERYDDLANTRRLHGYATTDLRLGYALGDAWSVQLSARNVFDKRYETAEFYNQPGRNYLLTLRYSPVH